MYILIEYWPSGFYFADCKHKTYVMVNTQVRYWNNDNKDNEQEGCFAENRQIKWSIRKNERWGRVFLKSKRNFAE